MCDDTPKETPNPIQLVKVKPAFDPADPLARIERETRRASAALRDYALMGAGRSLDKVLSNYRIQSENKQGAKPPTKRRATLATWNTLFYWGARVDRFDQIENDKELVKWEERRLALREADWNAGEALRKHVAEFMVELPTFLKTTEKIVEDEDGTKMKVVMLSLNTRLSELATVEQIASALQRLSADEPTQIFGLHGAAIDSAIRRGMGNLADLGKAGAPPSDTRDGSGGDDTASQPAGVDAAGGDHPATGTADGLV